MARISPGNQAKLILTCYPQTTLPPNSAGQSLFRAVRQVFILVRVWQDNRWATQIRIIRERLSNETNYTGVSRCKKAWECAGYELP